MNDRIKAAVMAGVAFAVLTIITAMAGAVVRAAGCCNCLIPIGGGLLAVYLYAKNSTTPIQIADGATLGAIAGAVGAAIYLVIGVPLAYFVNAAAMAAQMDQLRQSGINLPGALTGFALAIVGGIIAAILFVILSTLGGVIGAAIFGKNRPGGPIAPPPPPNFGGTPPPPPPAGGGYGAGV